MLPVISTSSTEDRKAILSVVPRDMKCKCTVYIISRGKGKLFLLLNAPLMQLKWIKRVKELIDYFVRTNILTPRKALSVCLSVSQKGTHIFCRPFTVPFFLLTSVSHYLLISRRWQKGHTRNLASACLTFQAIEMVVTKV